MLTKEKIDWFNGISNSMRQGTVEAPLTVEDIVKRLQLLPKDLIVRVVIPYEHSSGDVLEVRCDDNSVFLSTGRP